MTIFEKTVKMVATPLAIILWIYAATLIFNIALIFSIFFSIIFYDLAIKFLATLSTLLPILS
jgi:hypothetical protein